MAYLTFNYLNERSGFIKEALEIKSKYDFNKHKQNSVFLSHRHRDKNIVEKVVGFLQYLGGKIYVDYLDDILPDKTSFETASIL